MRIYVITDDKANIIGTLHSVDGFDARVVCLAGQNAYELELDGVCAMASLWSRSGSVLFEGTSPSMATPSVSRRVS